MQQLFRVLCKTNSLWGQTPYINSFSKAAIITTTMSWSNECLLSLSYRRCNFKTKVSLGLTFFEVSMEETASFFVHESLHDFYIYVHLEDILQPNFQCDNVGR